MEAVQEKEMSPPEASGSESRMKKYFGPGGFCENLSLNSVIILVNPVFAIALGVNPAWIGFAVAIPRLVDAFTDPLMGSISDNWRGRFGRRRPFVFIGAIFSGLCAALIWWTPSDMPPGFQFSWLLVFLLLSTIGTTVFGVPYLALGLESPSSKQARTEWQGWRSLYHKLSGVLVQWLFWMISLPVFAGALWGARIVGLGVGLLVMITGIIPAVFVSERKESSIVARKRVPLLTSWILTMKDRNFVVLACVSILIFSSILLVGQLGFFLAVFYVFAGDKLAASFTIAIGGTAFHLVGISAIPWMSNLSGKIGKARAFQICTASIAVGGITKIFCFVPGAGIWMALPSVFLGPGLVAVLVLLPSMLADVAAADERRHGSSRQGMYAASLSWINKLGQSGIVAISGLVLLWAGWENSLGADQAPGTFQNMRWAFAIGTILLALIAAAILCLYNLEDTDSQQPEDYA